MSYFASVCSSIFVGNEFSLLVELYRLFYFCSSNCLGYFTFFCSPNFVGNFTFFCSSNLVGYFTFLYSSNCVGNFPLLCSWNCLGNFTFLCSSNFSKKSKWKRPDQTSHITLKATVLFQSRSLTAISDCMMYGKPQTVMSRSSDWSCNAGFKLSLLHEWWCCSCRSLSLKKWCTLNACTLLVLSY